MLENKKTVNTNMTETGNNSKAIVNINPKEKCNTVVNRALESVYGHCHYYYKPYGGDDPLAKKEYVNKNGVNLRYIFTHKQILDFVFRSQTQWELALDIALKVFKNRDELLKLDEGNDNWSRYADFMKRHTADCGHVPPTYYRAYGYYYCSRFGAYLLPSMTSKEGQDWLKNARKFLQKYMDDGLMQNNDGTKIFLPSKRNPRASQTMSFPKQGIELDDKRFKTFAFNSHVPAYIDGGIQDVPFKDLVKILSEPNLQEWMDAETWKQAIQVAAIVYPTIGTVLDTASKAAKTIKNIF